MKYNQTTLYQKLCKLNYGYIILITLVSLIGFVMLYSASDGHLNPWALPQVFRFLMGFGIMLTLAISPIHLWIKSAYWIYGISLLLLIGVEIFGLIGMGAQRWLDLYIIRLQPSELMRIALVLALACYFHRSTLEDVKKPSFLLPPFLMIIIPVLLVSKQPDLGTALLLTTVGFGLFFVAGVPKSYFLGIGVITGAALPVLWHFLREYQKKRVLIFLDPGSDPLGSGYHILQSKIALGSGGIFGKGYMRGTQSHLNYLPEKQTDFIFTMFCEEFGMIGALILIALYSLMLFYGTKIALQCQSIFPRLLAIGVVMTLFIYAFVNMSMVMGLLPVVGIPLPLVSYGGTALTTLMISFGFLLNADLHSDQRLERY